MTARTLCRFGRKRRRDLLFAWLRVFPVWGVFPQIAQILAMNGSWMRCLGIRVRRNL